MAIGILFLMAACSSAPTPAVAPSPKPTHTAGVIGNDGYRFTVIAPPAWKVSTNGFFVIKEPPAPDPKYVIGLSVWDVGQVYRHPCHWLVGKFDPGPTVDDLVSALVAQPLRKATAPTSVRLAGYTARYLELSVPSDLKSVATNDFEGCDVDPSDGNRYFEGWTGRNGGDRYAQVPGQVDRVWVLDFNGQRLLVLATYTPATTSTNRDELSHIAESLQFVKV